MWEIVIKRGLGREDFKVNPRRLKKMLTANGYIELSFDAEHVFTVETLPLLHIEAALAVPSSEAAG